MNIPHSSFRKGGAKGRSGEPNPQLYNIFAPVSCTFLIKVGKKGIKTSSDGIIHNVFVNIYMHVYGGFTKNKRKILREL
jgi:hypothetical protein